MVYILPYLKAAVHRFRIKSLSDQIRSDINNTGQPQRTVLTAWVKNVGTTLSKIIAGSEISLESMTTTPISVMNSTDPTWT
jgi:hypothetical protein